MLKPSFEIANYYFLCQTCYSVTNEVNQQRVQLPGFVSVRDVGGEGLDLL